MEVDGVHGCINALNQLKQANDHLKTVLSIGGGGQGSAHFPAVAQSEFVREAFARNVRDTIDTFGFDGVDSTLPSIPRSGRC